MFHHYRLMTASGPANGKADERPRVDLEDHIPIIVLDARARSCEKGK